MWGQGWGVYWRSVFRSIYATTQLNLVQDDVDNDIPHLYDHSAHIAQYDQLWLSNDENWQEFIQHVHLHSLEAPQDDEEQAEEQAVAPHAGDKLWEIRCKVHDYPPPQQDVIHLEIHRLDRKRSLFSMLWKRSCSFLVILNHALQSLHAEPSLDEFLSSPKHYRTQLAQHQE